MKKDSFKDQIKDSFDLSNDLPSFDITPVKPFDGVAVSLETTLTARKLVLACIKLYYNEDIIDKNEFIQLKLQVASSNIATLLKQIKVAEHFIEKITNSVDSDNMNTRLFEVAAQLQMNIIELLKNVQLHTLTAQEELRRAKSEITIDNSDDVKIVNIDLPDKVFNNTKNLLKSFENE